MEHCINCHLHQWCSRHNEEKYQEFFIKVSAKAKAVFKNVTISQNQPPEHFTKHWGWSASHGQEIERYFDESKQ